MSRCRFVPCSVLYSSDSSNSLRLYPARWSLPILFDWYCVGRQNAARFLRISCGCACDREEPHHRVSNSPRVLLAISAGAGENVILYSFSNFYGGLDSVDDFVCLRVRRSFICHSHRAYFGMHSDSKIFKYCSKVSSSSCSVAVHEGFHRIVYFSQRKFFRF